MSSAAKAIVKDERMPSGSIIHWSESDGKLVSVTCGKCLVKREIQVPSVLRQQETNPQWPGFCQKCAIRNASVEGKYDKNSRCDVVQLIDGYVDFSKRNENGKPLIHCNICGEDRFSSPYGSAGEYHTGRCRQCQKLIVGDLPHLSGAIVHRTKRDPNDRERVAFTCSNPECCPDCGQTHYVYLAHTLQETWTGRCVECFEKLPHPNQNRGMEEVGHLKATLNWDDRDDSGKIAIICPFSWCGKKWYADLSTITNGKKNPDWLACCPEHYRGKSALLLVINNSNSLASHGDQNDNGQENSNGKKLRSPRRSNQTDKTLTVLGKTIEDLNRVILEIYDDLQVNSAVTETKAAYKLGLGRPKYGDEGHENIRRLLRRNKVQDKFPHYRDKIIAKHRSSTAYAIEEETTPQFNRRA